MGYAPNYTPRYRVKFIAAGVEHTLLLRQSRGTDIVAASIQGLTLAHDIYNAAAAFLADDFAWISAEQAATDSDLFVPATLPAAVVGAVDWVTGTWSPVKRVTGTTFSGRAAGSKARVTMWGLNFNVDLSTAKGGDALITEAEQAEIGTIAGLLSLNARANSGADAQFYRRATLKVNDRLLREVRKGTIS